MKRSVVEIKGSSVSYYFVKQQEYISLTDIARYKDSGESDDIIKNWFRNKNTLVFLGLWEKINNPKFKPVEFDGFISEAGINTFVMNPKKWIEGVNAIGIISKQGRGGGTFAHKDIAFEFASWISPEFKLYLIKEFQRLKLEESSRNSIDWDVKRILARVNYKVHTDAVKENLIPPEISLTQIERIYASEADVLNVALCGMTAKEWRSKNYSKKGNMRDYFNSTQLVCLSGLESINAEFIRQGMLQNARLKRLNEIAIIQMRSLTNNNQKGLLSK